MSKLMLVNVTHVEESRVAILEEGVLDQYEIETISRANIKGNIYNATVENVHPALEAAFLRISSDLKGFLPLDEVNFKLLPQRGEGRKAGRIGQHLHPGQKLMVQVVREPFAGKPPTVTTYFSLPGRYLVLMPGVDAAGISRKIEDAAQREKLKKVIKELNAPEGFGVIVRTAGVGQSKVELQRDLRYLLRLWESIQRASRATEFPGLVYRERDLVIRTMRDYFTPDIDEVWIDNPETHERALDFVHDVMPSKTKVIKLYTGDRPLFTKYNLEEQIESIYKRRVPLKSGGEIVIDGTEALTAVDVNSKGAPRQGDAEDNATQTNLEAAAEIARQLRLRDLGGLIVIDFIDMMASRNQKKVEKAMRDAMKSDRAKSDVTRISKLGLMEIARQRVRGEKMGALYATCPVCEGYGLVKNVEPAALAALRKLQVRCTRSDTGRIRMAVPPEVAHWILNHKREEIVQLERRNAIRILIEPKALLLRHESEFEFFPREKVEVPPALVILDRPAPPTPPDLKDLESEAAPDVATVTRPGPAVESSESALTGEAAASRKKRRRRRRRGRSGTGADAGVVEGDAATESEAETDGAFDAEVTRADEADSRGVDAAHATPAAPEDVADDRLEVGDEPAEENGPDAGAAADPSVPSSGGLPRRRRRRRRRGRGSQAAAGERAVAPTTEPAGTAAPHAEEISVPRGVRSEELVPAATGGRSRKAADGSWRARAKARRNPIRAAQGGRDDRPEPGRSGTDSEEV